MVAGDTCRVQAGTYDERVTSLTNGGTPGNVTTYIADGAVTMKGFAITKDYIVVNGFTITNVGNIGATGAINIRGNYVQILNNQVDGKNPTTQNAHEIDTGYSTQTNLLIQGNHIQRSISSGADYPLVFLICTNCTIDSNELGPAYDVDAFRVWGHDITISNNYLHDFSWSGVGSPHMDGLQIYGDCGSAWCQTSYNIYFERNRIINNDAAGTNHGQPFNLSNDFQAGIHDIYIRNNIFSTIDVQGQFGIPNIYLYNNLFYKVGEQNGMALNLLNGGGFECTGGVVRNNIFIATYNQPYYTGGGASVVTKDHNYVARLSGYLSITGFSETNTINGGDPKFTAPDTNDFHIASNSPAKDTGATISGWANPTDITGSPRPAGPAWDIGPYEYAATARPPAAPTGLIVK
jgi:hypothetical protein